jgi:hypothetical protein
MEITQDVLQAKTTQEVAIDLELDHVETTIGRDGYPEALKHAITAETITELFEIENKLNKAGFKTMQLVLHSKDGQQLPNRIETIIEKGMFQRVSDDDYAIELDMSDLSQVKQDVRDVLFGDVDDLAQVQVDNEEFESLEEAKAFYEKKVDEFISELPETGKFVVFYEPDQDHRIDYIVSEESTSYSYDTNNYQAAITIVWE